MNRLRKILQDILYAETTPSTFLKPETKRGKECTDLLYSPKCMYRTRLHRQCYLMRALIERLHLANLQRQ